MQVHGEPGLVSVITPVFNRAQFIEAAIDSIAGQRYRPVELVLADDGSTDESPRLIQAAREKYAEQAGFTIRYRRQENAGAASARNLGLRHCRGEFIVYVESDDVLYPNALEWGVDRLRANPDAALAYFRVQVADEHLRPLTGETLGKPPSGSDADYTDYLWHTMGPLYRRRTLHAAGPWDPQMRASDDWEYGSRIKLMGFMGPYDERIWGCYRQHEQERLNVYSFNHRYVMNVERALDLITRTAREQGRLSPTVSRLLARRYLVHALELGMHAHRADQQRLLRKAGELPHPGRLVAALARLSLFAGHRSVCALLYRLSELRLRAKGVKP